MNPTDDRAASAQHSPAIESREPAMRAHTTASAKTVRRGQQKPGRLWRRTTDRRAIAEATGLYALGVLIALVPHWPAPFIIFPLVLVARLVLFILPPVWAAMRVVSTRREKMSRRFWRMGPILALCCLAVATLVNLAIGEATPLGGVHGPSDFARLVASGPTHLALGAFLIGLVVSYLELAIYFTIAVICTRLANGGFLRFTMPAGNGRVTL